MVRFEPISTYIFFSMLNNSDSLTIGKTFIGEKNGRSQQV
jgi:hypothetical protein